MHTVKLYGQKIFQATADQFKNVGLSYLTHPKNKGKASYSSVLIPFSEFDKIRSNANNIRRLINLGIRWIHKNDPRALEHLGFNKLMQEVILKGIDKCPIIDRNYFSQPLMRLDFVMDYSQIPRMVDLRAGCVYGLPEAYYAYILEQYNGGRHQHIGTNMFHAIGKSIRTLLDHLPEEVKQRPKTNRNIAIVYEDIPGIDVKRNALFIHNIFKEYAKDYHITLLNIEKASVFESSGLINAGRKYHIIWSMLPFTHKFFSEDFWQLYLDDTIEVINGPLPLLFENRYFFTYIEQFRKRMWWVPFEALRSTLRYYLEEAVDTIKKPFLRRIGTGINGDEEDKNFVYQRKLEQRKFDFYVPDKKNELRKGYMKVGFFMTSSYSAPIGTYAQLFENEFSSKDSYFATTLIHKKTL